MLKVDLHIHSLHSGHAYGTIYDIINEAIKKKMEIIAITDHGPALTGSAPIFHFRIGFRKPKTPFTLLWGTEANVINHEGAIDIDPDTQKRLDVILIGIHVSTGFQDLGKEKNTEALIRAMNNNRVHILSHPNVMAVGPYDTEKVYREAIKRNILLEINLSYLKSPWAPPIESFKRIVDITRENNKKLIINTDSHFIHEIGDDSVLNEFWDKLGLTNDIIINNYPKELMEFLKSK